MVTDTWEEAHAYAQASANRLGLSHGIEWAPYDKRWRVRLLPAPTHRFGCDARCEAVEPERLARTEKVITW